MKLHHILLDDFIRILLRLINLDFKIFLVMK